MIGWWHNPWTQYEIHPSFHGGIFCLLTLRLLKIAGGRMKNKTTHCLAHFDDKCRRYNMV